MTLPADKRYLLERGITKEKFLAITWFTSWAVDANHSEDISDAPDSKSYLQPRFCHMMCRSFTFIAHIATS